MNLIPIFIAIIHATSAIMNKSTEQTDSVGFIKFDSSTLEVFEEKAYDFDDGAEIAGLYGPSLFNAFITDDPNTGDRSARILGVCLRNNEAAAKSIAETVPELPDFLHLDNRGLRLLGSLVSTQPGRELVHEHQTIKKFQNELAHINTTNFDSKLITEISKLLRTLSTSGVDGEVWNKWVSALEQAYYTTQNEEFKNLAVEIVNHENDFSHLTVQCKLQPGISSHYDEKRAVETANSIPNKFAARNHFDL